VPDSVACPIIGREQGRSFPDGCALLPPEAATWISLPPCLVLLNVVARDLSFSSPLCTWLSTILTLHHPPNDLQRQPRHIHNLPSAWQQFVSQAPQETCLQEQRPRSFRGCDGMRLAEKARSYTLITSHRPCPIGVPALACTSTPPTPKHSDSFLHAQHVPIRCASSPSTLQIPLSRPLRCSRLHTPATQLTVYRRNAVTHYTAEPPSWSRACFSN
jgi:hypothetical protein